MAKVLSLKTRSYLLSILVVGGVWSITAWFSYQSSSEVIHRLIDEQLRHEFTLLERQVDFAIANYEQFQPDLDTILWDTDTTQIDRAIIFWNKKGERLVASFGAPMIERPQGEGYSTQMLPGPDGEEEWRVLYGPVKSGVEIAVVLNHEAAAHYIREIGLGSLQPLMIALIISALAVMLGFAFSWRPIMDLLQQVSSRTPKSLEPIPIERTPKELQPFIQAINELMERLQRALEAEHQFTANAAHELQTPLAAIKTEVQLCQRRNHDPGVSDMLDRIEERVDRATKMVKQLLMLARLEASDAKDMADSVDLDAVIVDSISAIAHLLVEQNRDIEFSEGNAIRVRGNRELLEILVRNLLDNALLYSPEKSPIQAGAGVDDSGQVRIVVANESEPISAEDREKMLETFYRIPGTGAKGSGLGLSIVKRIAEMSGARLEIDDWEGHSGVEIRVIFPRRAA